ncbi:MAG: FAD:protein FMN transferase, partial [Planctomycetota bacterium]
GRLELSLAGMQLDLGGIGKGFAADAAAEVLVARGCPRHLVDVGGDLRAGAAPPRRRGWTVALQPSGPGRDAIVLWLENAAVAASGDTEQFLEIDGRRYSHIVDPRTGIGLTTRAKVTVVAPDATAADALASALSVLGPDAGFAALPRVPGSSAMIERRLDDGSVGRSTSASFPAPAAIVIDGP